MSCEELFSNQPLEEIRITGKTMGTFYNITVVGSYPGGAEQLQYDAENVLKTIVDEISTFDPNSTISKFNATRSNEPIEISNNFADIVIESMRVGKELNGAMDITVNPLVNLWGFGAQKVKGFPTDEEIATAKSNLGLDKIHIEISKDKNYIRKSNPNVEIDLATVGEGFGADKLAQLLDRKGINNYMTSVAGAIRTKGHNARGAQWLIAIEDPSNEQQVGKNLTSAVCINSAALSTAGSYRNYRKGADGKRESHIIDPNTGRPIQHETVSVSVIGNSALWTDAVDTGLLVMGSEAALKYANENNIPIFTIVKTDKGFESHSSRAMKEFLDCKQ